MSQKISVDIAEFHKASVPPELQRIAGGPKETVILIPRQLTKTVVKNVLTANSPPPPMYLTGPGGVGKSSILFMTAAAVLRHNAQLLKDCTHNNQQDEDASSDSSLSSPILLLYIANAGELITLSCEEAALRLCKTIKSLNHVCLSQFSDVLGVIDRQDLSSLERWNQLCLNVCASDIRNLILVDQWNAIIETTLSSDHPLSRFRTIETKIGFSKFVAAVSSSFTPIDADRGVFRDAEAETAKCKIEPLGLEDLKALRDIWLERDPSVDVDDTTLFALYECTGGIPRLCEFFAAARAINCGVTIDDPDWRQQCTNYYVGRMKSLSRNLSDLKLRKCFQNELASLFLRCRELPNADSVFATRWLSSGLLIPDTSRRFLVPVNLFVRKAIDSYVSNEQTLLLRNMYADKSTSWRAVELFIFLQLRNGRTKLTGTDLRGTEQMVLQLDHQDIQVIDVSRDFASDPKAFLDRHNHGQPFPPGSLLIPTWTAHPVADAVLYAKVENYSNPQIIFIQVSTSSYADHNKKIPDLHPKVHDCWKFSVLESYHHAFGVTCKPNRDIAKGKLPKNVQYVYATTNPALLGGSTRNSGDGVFLMRRENIKNMDEQFWLEMAHDTS